MTTTRTHTAIATTAKGVVESIQSLTVDPGPQEVVVKVAYSAVVAPDVYMADHGMMLTPDDYPVPLGLSLSGHIDATGTDVVKLKKGDRVCAFTLLDHKAKGLQLKAVVSQTTCAKIPDSLDLADAASIPDNFVTAFYTLFGQLKLTLPDSFPASSPPVDADVPILIYGAGATVGQYAIQLLKLAKYSNVIATASAHHHEYLRSLGAKHTVDYRTEDMAAQIIAAAGGKVPRVLDCISAEGTLKRVAQVVQSGAMVALLLPIKEGDSVITKDGKSWMEIPSGRNPFADDIEIVGVTTFFYQQNEFMKEKLMSEILPELLVGRLIEPSRIRMFGEGTLLERVLAANAGVAGSELLEDFTILNRGPGLTLAAAERHRQASQKKGCHVLNTFGRRNLMLSLN